MNQRGIITDFSRLSNGKGRWGTCAWDWPPQIAQTVAVFEALSDDQLLRQRRRFPSGGGKTILVPFPFTDLSSAKVRPAVIVSEPKYSREDVTVVFVSAKTGKSNSATDYHIKSAHQHFRNTGFKTDSVVVCRKIATLDKKIVLGEIGALHPEDQQQIDQRIKLALGLS